MSGLYPLLWRWHLLIGLVVAPVLLVMSLSDALYAFAPQLEPRLDAPLQVPPACAGCALLPLDRLLATVHADYPVAVVEQIRRAGPGRSLEFHLEEGAAQRIVYVDPYRGNILGARAPDAGLFGTLLALHRSLLAGRAGRWLTELAASWTLVTLGLGLALWWPRRRKLDGGWRPRLAARGRRFWRDLHSVTGLYLLPLVIVIAATGLLFTQAAGRVLFYGMHAVGQLPDAYVRPPRVEVPPAATRIPLQMLLSDFLGADREQEFRLALPSELTKAVRIEQHVGFEPWRLRIADFDPYTGTRLNLLTWDTVKPGARLLLLYYPLHTGTIAGLPTQLLACAAALLLAGVTLSGVWMWWRRRAPGSTGIPASAKSTPRALWLTVTMLALLMPAFGASLLAVAAACWLRLRIVTSKSACQRRPRRSSRVAPLLGAYRGALSRDDAAAPQADFNAAPGEPPAPARDSGSAT